MNIHHSHLYIATTWGCLVIVDKVSMETLNVLRCHGSTSPYICAILTLNLDFPLEPEDDASSSSVKTDDSSLSPAEKLSEGQRSSLIVTVGKGYRDLIRRNMYVKAGALSRETDRNEMYVVTWRAEGWEHCGSVEQAH